MTNQYLAEIIFNLSKARVFIIKYKSRLLIGLFVLVLVAYLAIPFSTPFFSVDYSVVVRDENNRFLRVFLNNEEQWCLPPEKSDTIPEKLKKAVSLFEDEYFYKHPGINPVSLLRAFKQNLSQGKIVSGASTLTMQVARIRHGNSRTYWQKIKEITEAFKIECHYSKDEILKFYLDHAPYGANIQGIQAASYRYFDKTPKELSWAEAATLAVLPNAPGIIFPTTKGEALKRKRDRLLHKLFDKAYIDKSVYELAILEPIPAKIYSFPMLAPHFARFVKAREYQHKNIKTTLNADLQKQVAQLTRLHMQRLRNSGIKNAAVLVTDTQTGKIKAWVGSQNFFDFETLGQVDGVLASRSSGSVLKPFLYGLAIDQGIILPQTLVKDVPTYFNAFSPHNADEKFQGIVTAQYALIHSLNVPAVRLLNAYGVYPFYAFLKSAGVSTLFREAEDYGLPLIIGGSEVNLFDMSKLYRGLAQGGVFTSIIYQDADSLLLKEQNQALISQGSCNLVLNMLTDLKRPGLEYHWRKFEHQHAIAWKTGTSYGHKDAWAIGVSPQWTIAVWVGNFDGEGNVQLAGTTSAGPLLFDVFNALPYNPELNWFKKPYDEFKQIRICKTTGFLAGPSCTEIDTVDAPIYMEPLRLCPFHKTIFVDKEERFAVCSECWKPGYHAKQVLSYPPDVVYQLRLRGQITEKIPEHNPNCPAFTRTNPMEFIYPKDSSYLWLPRDFGGVRQKLICKLAHAHSQKNVFWYLNDVYLGTSDHEHTKTIDFTNGWQILRVTDEDGNSQRVTFFVERKN
jgi:penicillin-binding protein 1C